MAISTKGKLYGDYRAQGKSQRDSAELAGYKHPDSVCSRLEADPNIQEYVKEITKEVASSRIATAQERQEFWTSVARGELVDFDNEGAPIVSKMSDRLRAAELLGKAQMDFIERKEITGKNGQNLNIEVIFGEEN